MDDHIVAQVLNIRETRLGKIAVSSSQKSLKTLTWQVKSLICHSRILINPVLLMIGNLVKQGVQGLQTFTFYIVLGRPSLLNQKYNVRWFLLIRFVDH